MSQWFVNSSQDNHLKLEWMEAKGIQPDLVLLEGDIAGGPLSGAASGGGPKPGGGPPGGAGLREGVGVGVGAVMGDEERSLDTLDEPISVTLMRDLKGIGSKMRHILLPTSSASTYRSVLKDWDLWGPLILCTFMGLTLHHKEAVDGRIGPHFAEIFVLIWFGSYVVSLNYKLLSLSPTRRRHGTGGKTSLMASPSIYQLLCVFGYCLAPPCAGILLLKAVEAVLTLQIRHLFVEKLLVGLLLGFLWPTLSALKILSKYQEKEKRLLAVYPIGLFYFIISWFIISAH